MDDRRAMFEAHVRFELDRWEDAALREAVAEEVDALFAWCGQVRIDELAPPDEVRSVVQRTLAAPLPEPLDRMLAEGIGAVRDALVRHDARLADLIAEEDYAAVVEIVVEMRHVRRELIDQITTSSVYAQLIAHVLYQGIKDYLGTQNVLTRRIPGASSVLRLGQSAVSAAAPGLERSVDRQLTAFIAGNVAETVRGSGAFLARILHDDMVRAVAGELWSKNAERSLGDLVWLVSEPPAGQVLAAGRAVWEGVRATPVLAEIVTAVLDGFYAAHGERTPAELLADLGITPAVLVGQLAATASPVVRAARESGFLEARVRARLEAFYASYPGA